MPIYEFHCSDCNRVFSFFARGSAATKRRPKCPRCGGRRMSKLFSRFAMSTRRPESPKTERGGTGGAEGPGDLSHEQEARMERAMMGLGKDIDKIDENDPRQMASVIRRLSDATGEPIDEATREMICRLESGEDPDKVEDKMADAFGPEEGAGAGYGDGPSYDGGLYDL